MQKGWNVSIPAVLGAWSGGNRQNLAHGRTVIPAVFGSCGAGGAFGSPDVATRDFGKPQTLNNGASISMPTGLTVQQAFTPCYSHQTPQFGQAGGLDSVLSEGALLLRPSVGKGGRA